MSKEAMKLALDALEVATTPLANDRQEVLRAQAALREALAEHPAQGCEYCNHPLYAGTKCKNCGRMTEQAAIKQDLTPEQPAQQEPVVWMYVNKSTHETKFQKHMRDFIDHSLWSEVPLYGEPLANHELQCVCGAVWCGDEMVHLPDKRPPAQRKPLTSEEVSDLRIKHGITSNGRGIKEFTQIVDFVRDIETKLKEQP